MDQGNGQFKEYKNLGDLIGEHPEKFNIKDGCAPNEDLMKALVLDSGVFQEGEILEIKGSKFEVRKIIQNGLKLKLLPK